MTQDNHLKTGREVHFNDGNVLDIEIVLFDVSKVINLGCPRLMVLKWRRINWTCFNLLFTTSKCTSDVWITNSARVFDVITNSPNLKNPWNAIKNKALSKSIWAWSGSVCLKAFTILVRISPVIGKRESTVGPNLWHPFNISCTKKHWAGSGISRI